MKRDITSYNSSFIADLAERSPSKSQSGKHCTECGGAHQAACKRCGYLTRGSCLEAYPEGEGICLVCHEEMNEIAEAEHSSVMRSVWL